MVLQMVRRLPVDESAVVFEPLIPAKVSFSVSEYRSWLTALGADETTVPCGISKVYIRTDETELRVIPIRNSQFQTRHRLLHADAPESWRVDLLTDADLVRHTSQFKDSAEMKEYLVQVLSA